MEGLGGVVWLVPSRGSGCSEQPDFIAPRFPRDCWYQIQSTSTSINILEYWSRTF